MHLFYHPENPINGVIVPLDEEVKHIRATRIREGEHVGCTDGKGNLHTCELVTDKKNTALHVLETATFKEKTPRLMLAVAPTKNQDRLEWLIEKAVEIGVHAIIPILSEHSEKPFLKSERLQRVAVAAIKQSEKYFLPRIHELTSFQEVFTMNMAQKFIAHCAVDASKKQLNSVLELGKDALICIGPEGDFSTREIETAKQNGFIAVSLGEERLRTETAGMVATTVFQMKQLL